MEFRVLSSSYNHNNRLAQDSETGEWEMSGSQSLIFEVTPDGLYDIEFDDGNRFRGYRKNPSGKEKDNEIYIAKLYVERSDVTGKLINQFVTNKSGQKIYQERYISYDPDINKHNDFNDELMCVININCKIAGREFDELLNFIRHGNNPTSTLQILMLGYMNEEAFAKTQQEKKLHFLVVVKIAYGQKENPQATFYW